MSKLAKTGSASRFSRWSRIVCASASRSRRAYYEALWLSIRCDCTKRKARSIIPDVKKATLAELREKARAIVSETPGGDEHPLLQLVEDLCREGDRLTDDAKKEHDDLVRQVGVSLIFLF